MWLNRFTQYLFRHRFQALMLTFICTFLPVLGTLSILIAALVTLRKGIVEGGIFALAATVPYLISAYVGGVPPAAPFYIWGAVGIIMISNILTWVFAGMLRKNGDFSLVLQFGALLGMLVVSVVHLIYPHVDAWWQVQLTAYFNQSPALLGNSLQGGATTPTLSQIEMIETAKFYATGFVVAGILINGLLQLVLARWWQAIIYSPGSLRKELHNIRLSRLAGLFFVGGIALSYMGNKVALDVMPILYTIFFIAGLSLLHYMVAAVKTSGILWLTLLYMAMVWTFPLSIVIVAFAAFFDAWFDFRRFFIKTV